MAVATVRNNGKKMQRDGNGPPNSNQRRGQPAWRGGPPSFAHSHQNNRNQPPSQPTHGFPVLVQQQAERGIPNMEQALNTNIIVHTRNGGRHSGLLVSLDPDARGFTLKNYQDLSNPNAVPQDSMHFPSLQIADWQAGDVPNGNGAQKAFRTDADISQSGRNLRERELQAWTPEAPSSGMNPPPYHNGGGAPGDDSTFGAGAGASGHWDQFDVNHKLFGVTTDFNEELYTTKLDRSHPDFKERERRAIQIANEIQNSSTSNPHIAEERNLADDSGVNEEDKYGAVVRGPGAYVPPGARGSLAPIPPRTETNRSTNTAGNPAPDPVAVEVPQLSVNGPDGKPSPASAVPKAGENNLVGTFREFVSNEKQRLAQKKQQIVKKERDGKIADLVKFSQEFKLNRPIPRDLVPILAKDEKKQQEIIQKSVAEAESVGARAIGTQPSSGTAGAHRVPLVFPPPASKPDAQTRRPAASASPVVLAAAPPNSTSTAKAAAPTSKADPSPSGSSRPPPMVIQKIPPFRKKSESIQSNSASNSGNGNSPAQTDAIPAPASPTASQNSSASAAFKLNVKASSFRPNPNASAFKPSAGSSSPTAGTSVVKPRPEQKSETPNQFFGTRLIKKQAVHIKDDFNPFKYAKVTEASSIPPNWPYSGKRYMQQMFPVVPPAASAPPISGPPTFEEDPAQVAARGYGMMYAYGPYPYPGQHPQQQMMAVPAGAPPGGYMPSPFMQPMPYPPPPHQGNGPPSMYGPPPMNGMPPSQGYLPPPPPGPYPPNGAPRGSMPPTPIPQHAYAYHQSPQMPHAVPYPMMMGQPAPPPPVPPHPYDAQGGPPGAPGPGPMNVGH